MRERLADLSVDVHVAVNAASSPGVAAVVGLGPRAGGAVGRIGRVGSRSHAQRRDGRTDGVPVPGAHPGVA